MIDKAINDLIGEFLLFSAQVTSREWTVITARVQYLGSADI